MFAPPGRRPVAPEKGPRKSTGRASEGFRPPRWFLLGMASSYLQLLVLFGQVHQPRVPQKNGRRWMLFGGKIFFIEGAITVYNQVLDLNLNFFWSALICLIFLKPGSLNHCQRCEISSK